MIDPEISVCGAAYGTDGLLGTQSQCWLDLSQKVTPHLQHCDTSVPAPQSEACRTSAAEREKAANHCCINLPDGTSCVVAVRSGFSIKEILSGLCERHGINGAAVDLFLVGGDKVLVHRDPGPLHRRATDSWPCPLPALSLTPLSCSAEELGPQQGQLLGKGCVPIQAGVGEKQHSPCLG